ncbi:MAG: zinc-binding dehydrogenase [Kiritimatiellae bacterium]|nr:zinc-binding dehydrogenase [Verrucomicrobiota bacterium]MCG2659418.1 zinc-binding dehydrogenase [Kiritimatiellia bacterium]
MKQKIKAIVFTAPNQIQIREFELPPCGPQEVICETIYSFVSPGTELRVLSGVAESKGKFPLIPGYSWVGRVIEVGTELKGWKEGDLVTGRNPIRIPDLGFMWGGQASHHRAEVTGYDSVLKLPEGANPWNYIAVEVSAISWRGVSIAFPAPGETAVVIGQGLIGAFNALWLLHHGARVIVVDLVEARLARARKWGVAATVNPKDGDARAQILALVPGGADIVIESSSSKPGVELASQILRQPTPRVMNTDYPVAALHSNAHFWPRLVYQASYTHSHEVRPGGLTGSEGTLVMKPGDRTVGDRLQVLELIRRGKLCVEDIVKAPTPVEEAPGAYFKLRDNPDKYNTIVYQW